ncbi:MAG TPA: hypothetical protein VHB30_01230 [Solirubrobacteraceae bacterium]|jgi:hypothetical protein|nr:hypothetical protein [Solirubrobacteraceae bacterium]
MASPASPQLEIVAPAASPEEAAAIAAAIRRFLDDHATPPPASSADASEAESAWLRAARREAVDRRPRDLPWGRAALPGDPAR